MKKTARIARDARLASSQRMAIPVVVLEETIRIEIAIREPFLLDQELREFAIREAKRFGYRPTGKNVTIDLDRTKVSVPVLARDGEAIRG